MDSICGVREWNYRVQCWLEYLSNFTYTLEYRKDPANGYAFFLPPLSLPAVEADAIGQDQIDNKKRSWSLPSPTQRSAITLIEYTDHWLAWARFEWASPSCVSWCVRSACVGSARFRQFLSSSVIHDEPSSPCPSYLHCPSSRPKSFRHFRRRRWGLPSLLLLRSLG